MHTDLLHKALEYAKSGWPVFPCRAGDKAPLTPCGFKDATTDASTIEAWWTRWPDANIGLPTGQAAAIFVLDVDVKKDERGDESLNRLIAEHGDLPATLAARTPSGGHHYFFQYPGELVKSTAGLRPGLDIRGDRGYVVVAPSIVGDAAYEWIDPDTPIARAPGWLLEVIAEGSKPTRFHSTPAGWTGTGWPEGERNDGIFRYACRLRGKDVPYEEAYDLVLSAADRCSPPLDHGEAIQCLDSAYTRYEPNRHRPLTDFGNAERLIDRYGDYLRYVPPYKSWFVWTGTHWAEDVHGQAHQWAKETVRAIPKELDEKADEEYATKLLKFAKQSEQKTKVDAMLDLAAKEPEISVPATAFDSDPLLLGCADGVLDLRTGELHDPDPSSMISCRGKVSHDRDADCPQWRRFVYEIMGQDQELTDFLQRAVGYTLTGDTSEQKVFFLYGTGANGKSTFLSIIEKLLGDYARSVAAETLMTRRHQQGSGPTEDIARLQGARLASTAETEEGQVLSEALVKRMTGEDTLVARRPHAKHSIEFKPQFKVWVAANHRPIIRNDDHAIWRRICQIPFTVQFSESQQDRGLQDKLLGELPGILNWALEGCQLWQEHGLSIPDAVVEATREYREEMDLLAEWLESECEFAPEYYASVAALYSSYLQWTSWNNADPLNRSQFGRKLQAKGYNRCKVAGQRCYKGLCTRPVQSEFDMFKKQAA